MCKKYYNSAKYRHLTHRTAKPATFDSPNFFRLEDQGKEGNPEKKRNIRYEQCPVED